MALYIHKYGGTSLATIKNIHHVVDKIIAAREAGDYVVVVVSAMGGETNRLLDLAGGLPGEAAGREFASLVACGELMSMSLLTLTLQSCGCPARSFKAGEAGIFTTDEFDCAQITEIHPHAILTALEAGEVPVVAGFQGVNAEGELTTLGRGGSDATAVALTNALAADECQIYTDVHGVHTVDPVLWPEAPCLPIIRADEMLALAEGGARLVQPYALELAICYAVPVRILPTFYEGEGTQLIYRGDAYFTEQEFGLGFKTEDGESLISYKSDEPQEGEKPEFLTMTIVHREFARSPSFVSKVLNLLKNKGIKVFAEHPSTIALSALIEENGVHAVVDCFKSPDAVFLRESAREAEKKFCETE